MNSDTLSIMKLISMIDIFLYNFAVTIIKGSLSAIEGEKISNFPLQEFLMKINLIFLFHFDIFSFLCTLKITNNPAHDLSIFSWEWKWNWLNQFLCGKHALVLSYSKRRWVFGWEIRGILQFYFISFTRLRCSLELLRLTTSMKRIKKTFWDEWWRGELRWSERCDCDASENIKKYPCGGFGVIKKI